MSELAGLADALLPSVLKAGRIVMRYFRQNPAVTTKAGGSPVTAADHEAELALLEALAVAVPGTAVVAEEMMEGRTAAPCGREFFLVDPLDGTRGFVEGHREFTINIGLIENRIPRFGVIYAPALSRLFVTLGPDTAVAANVSPDAAVTAIADLETRRLRTRPVQEGEPLKVCASRSHGRPGLEAWLKTVSVATVTRIASSLKFCWIAEGEADVYPRFGPTSEWDTAAGHAILAAAGGVVTCSDGGPLFYGKHETGFVNPPFIAAARRMESLFTINADALPRDDA